MNDPTTITTVDELLAACADHPAGCISLHLDDDGIERCATRPTIVDSLEQWANDPSRLIDAAASTDNCGRRSIIFVRQHTPPTEHDASHYLDVAAALACEGVTLIDCVIAWNDNHVSMHYLEHRTTSYRTPAAGPQPEPTIDDRPQPTHTAPRPTCPGDDRDRPGLSDRAGMSPARHRSRVCRRRASAWKMRFALNEVSELHPTLSRWIVDKCRHCAESLNGSGSDRDPGVLWSALIGVKGHPKLVGLWLSPLRSWPTTFGLFALDPERTSARAPPIGSGRGTDVPTPRPLPIIKRKGTHHASRTRHQPPEAGDPMKAVDVMADIVDRLIAEIENGAQQWRMPWNTATGLPHNAVTGNTYRGANILALWLEALMCGYTSSRWATYKQWQSIDAQVRRGQTGTRLIRWVDKKRNDDTAAASTNDDDTTAARLIPVSFSVFNIAQCDTATTTVTVEVTPRHEGSFAHFFDAIPAVIRWGAGQPCYRPDLDEVCMPEWEAFHTTAAGHATLAHELAHWTGHPTRLDRDLTGRFGDDAYAAEELIAEMSAAFTCAEVGIAPAIRDDHAPYLDHWLRILQAEPRHLWSVASTAQAVTDHLASYSTPTASQRAA